MKSLISRLARLHSGRVLLSGVVAALTGVEYLLSTRSAPKAARLRTEPLFTIRRTSYDAGLSYWVLQGHGELASYALFDYWHEAVDEANRQLQRFQARRNLVTAL